MSALLLQFLFLLISSLLIRAINGIDPYGTCDEPFIVFKHTVATSDSLRDCDMLWKIFPDIHDEGASKFHQGECAYQCKMELPYSCFKIHAPQTAFDEGLLYINTFEKKMSEKWKYALQQKKLSSDNYDTFFDFNIAFWVKDLDDYINHWQSAKTENGKAIKFEYFGIEWYLNDDINIKTSDPSYQDYKFYSILLHSPDSAAIFEFISYTKPKGYDSIKWITDNIPRATFKTQSNPYPWDREDEATIMPIRISHATTNIDQLYDFYHNLLYADLLYYANAISSDTKTIFMGLQDTHIEMQFIQRAASATYGAFSLEKYENLLMETHETIITSPFCGQDRWMDNHYAYSTWTIPGLMDKIYQNLLYNGIKFKVGKNTYEHASVHTKYQLDLVGYDGQYTFGLWVIEPGGQSIKIGGIIQSDPNVGYYASFGDPQWCLHACSWGLTPGYVDPSRIYKDADDMRITNGNNIIGLEKEEMIISDINNEELKQFGIDWEYILFVSMGMMIVFGLCAIGYFKCYGDEAPNYKLMNPCCSEYISV